MQSAMALQDMTLKKLQQQQYNNILKNTENQLNVISIRHYIHHMKVKQIKMTHQTQSHSKIPDKRKTFHKIVLKIPWEIKSSIIQIL